MSSLAGPRASFGRATIPQGLVVLAASAGAVVTRAATLHHGLLYPDGYQYLLMARGLAAHDSPVVRLGSAGDVFVPNADAAAKPLFPLAVAGAHLLGLPLRQAANMLTVLGAAAAPVLCAAIVLRLTRSRLAAAAAFAACLASPTASYWWGFAGPDALAVAFGLAGALAALWRRPTLAGALAGAALSTRPELAILAVGAAAGLLASPRTRAAGVLRGICAALLTVAVILVIVRPPLALPVPALLVAGGAGLAGTVIGIVARRRLFVPLVALGAFASILGASPAAEVWLRSDWPLVAAGFAGLAIAAVRGDRVAAGCTAVALATLALVYHVKNPALDRYLAEVVPLIAIGIGLGIAAFPRRHYAAVAAIAAAAMSVLLPSGRSPVGLDSFAALAPKLTDGPELPLVTAAPDAYGYLLPSRSVVDMRPGARGLVLLDGAQRAFTPNFTAQGTVVATFDHSVFRGSNGTLDRRDTRLVRGVVVIRRR